MASLEKIKMRHVRLRKRITGTAERPRLAVHFSGKNIYAQVIDDVAGRTLAAAATTEKSLEGDKSLRANCATSRSRMCRTCADGVPAAHSTAVETQTCVLPLSAANSAKVRRFSALSRSL